MPQGETPGSIDTQPLDTRSAGQILEDDLKPYELTPLGYGLRGAEPHYYARVLGSLTDKPKAYGDGVKHYAREKLDGSRA